MIPSRCLVTAVVLALLSPAARAQTPPPSAQAPDPAALLFSQRCSTCHNLGGGAKVGPDLLGVIDRRDRAWFGKFVRGPGALIDAGDPIATELFKGARGVRMPDQKLSDGELDGLWAYFTSCTAKRGCTPVPVGPRWGTDATADEIERGRALFAGERRLARGGAACFTCHDVRGLGFLGGGTLGGDVTFAYARLGEKGLSPLLAEPATPVMKAAYEHAPLDGAEQFAIKAYFASLARDGSLPRREHDFFWLGLEGMAIVLASFKIAGGQRAKRRHDEEGPR